MKLIVKHAIKLIAIKTGSWRTDRTELCPVFRPVFQAAKGINVSREHTERGKRIPDDNNNNSNNSNKTMMKKQNKKWVEGGTGR